MEKHPVAMKLKKKQNAFAKKKKEDTEYRKKDSWRLAYMLKGVHCNQLRDQRLHIIVTLIGALHR